MQLFKRVLLSLFPDEIITQSVNPASMFVSFISTKEFFSVINRKIVENYKLNMFDVAIDPIEFKVGFGDKPSIKVKQMDLYYGYCSTANLNGYRFINPVSLSNVLSLAISPYVKDSFEQYDQNYYLYFLYTVYLLTFVFVARIKIFPENISSEEAYNRFVSVFFEFYKFVYKQTANEYSDKILLEIQNKVLEHADIFFLLKEVYKYINDLIYDGNSDDSGFYNWLFAEELKKKQYGAIIRDFIQHKNKYSCSTKFSVTEQRMLGLVLPADILIRYIFMDVDMFMMTDYIISKIYKKDILDKYISEFRKGDGNMEELILYLTDYRHFKKNFFGGLKKYIVTKFSDDNVIDDIESNDKVDEFLSSIGDDMSSLENIKIPDRLKKESKMMEKVLNFYVTLIGGFWVARGDSMYLRAFRKELLDDFLIENTKLGDSKYTIDFYSSLLYLYGKNSFYYKYASENIKLGKQKFVVPYKANLGSVSTNTVLLNLTDENFIATLLQDILQKDVRIYIKNPDILEFFKIKYSANISKCIKLKDKDLLAKIYGNIQGLLSGDYDFVGILSNNIYASDLYNLKDNLYTLDFQMFLECIDLFNKKKVKFKKYFSDMAIIGILSILRETLLGFLLYMTFLDMKEKEDDKNYNIMALVYTYITEVLNIKSNLHYDIPALLRDVFEDNVDLLQKWLNVDDNIPFMHILFDNWLAFTEEKDNIQDNIIGEDVVWFRGALKNITYYNKRYLMPPH